MCKKSTAPSPAFQAGVLLAGDLEDTPKDGLIRLELPGLDKEDCHIRIDDNALYVRLTC
ncbi:MAG: HSP20 family protein [Rhodoferax sp.]|jgi:HSP20 family protein